MGGGFDVLDIFWETSTQQQESMAYGGGKTTKYAISNKYLWPKERKLPKIPLK